MWFRNFDNTAGEESSENTAAGMCPETRMGKDSPAIWQKQTGRRCIKRFHFARNRYRI